MATFGAGTVLARSAKVLARTGLVQGAARSQLVAQRLGSPVNRQAVTRLFPPVSPALRSSGAQWFRPTSWNTWVNQGRGPSRADGPVVVDELRRPGRRRPRVAGAAERPGGHGVRQERHGSPCDAVRTLAGGVQYAGVSATSLVVGPGAFVANTVNSYRSGDRTDGTDPDHGADPGARRLGALGAGLSEADLVEVGRQIPGDGGNDTRGIDAVQALDAQAVAAGDIWTAGLWFPRTAEHRASASLVVRIMTADRPAHRLARRFARDLHAVPRLPGLTMLAYSGVEVDSELGPAFLQCLDTSSGPDSPVTQTSRFTVFPMHVQEVVVLEFETVHLDVEDELADEFVQILSRSPTRHHECRAAGAYPGPVGPGASRDLVADSAP
ncbi:hypothetical protein NKG05_05815 [Oerskovia sp. M15]